MHTYLQGRAGPVKTGCPVKKINCDALNKWNRNQ